MKTGIIIYVFLAAIISAGLWFLIAKKPTPTGLSIGEIKAYSIVKKYAYEGISSGLLVNQKGFAFSGKTIDRILITQTDNNGKKIFTAREPIINRDAVISNLNMATDPKGARLCAVWAESINEGTRLYYKFLDIESRAQAEAVEINETNPISYLNIFYNSTNDEFIILYIAESIPKLIIVDSMGFSNPPLDLSFEITSNMIKTIWNEYDNLYAAVTHKQADSFSLIQFDINGNLIADNSFTIDNITKPNNICIYYDQINNVYNIFVSQKDILHQMTIDSQSNILSTKQNKLPSNFNGEFDIADNGQSYDLFYPSGLLKKIIHTSISHEGEYSKKYNKLIDIDRYNEGINPSVALSNEKLGILYTIDKENAVSSLGIAMPYKSGSWGASKKSDISAYGGRPVNVVERTWEELPPATTRPATITTISGGNEGTPGRSTGSTHKDIFREIDRSISNILTDLSGQPEQIIIADAREDLRIAEIIILRIINDIRRFKDKRDKLNNTKDSDEIELARLINRKKEIQLQRNAKKKVHQDALLSATRAKGQIEKNKARIKANQAQSLLQELNRTLQNIDIKIHEQEGRIANINTSISMAENMLNQENNKLSAAIKRRDDAKKIIDLVSKPGKETKSQRRSSRRRGGVRR